MLLVNLWAIQNDAKLWEEPNELKPERFIDFKGRRDGFRLMPFGYGRRGCPGENLAMHVAGLALGSLIQCFEWERISEELVDMTGGPGLTMPKAIPWLAKCKPRQNIDNLLAHLVLAGKHLGYNYTNLVWASYGRHWRNLRQIAILEILSTRVQMFADIRRGEVHALLQRLVRGTTNGGHSHTVDMKEALFEMTLNILMMMIAGKQYYGDSAEELEKSRRFKEIVTESFQLSGATNIGDFVPLLEWIGVNRLEDKVKLLKDKRDKFMQDLIEEHKNSKKGSSVEQKNNTMIDVLLSLQDSEPNYYTDEVIRGMSIVMLTAGTDTTASTMEWALSLLLNNPEALKKVQKEIDTHIGESSRLLDDSDLVQLPYLHGIINETLRMCPAAPILVPHESSDECVIGGFRVPRGTLLLVNLWAIQNDFKLWEEPNDFKPERFIDFKGQRDGFRLMPFGYGKRGCPGENLAMHVAGLALGSLIQCFEWERTSEEPVDMTGGPGLTMPKAIPLLAKCRPRQNIDNLLAQL
ncbi:hypothetical protein RND71_026915 [Anisodus tanguticus]|uniref:Cytochrome P450 n=1 Tax=Anisodus tanguticus TaxID=243964 RepID=A0AAE1RN55_9SOLA|nr:hypothetical protein RND71_026915 [Anisodus tanguticus]